MTNAELQNCTGTANAWPEKKLNAATNCSRSIVTATLRI